MLVRVYVRAYVCVSFNQVECHSLFRIPVNNIFHSQLFVMQESGELVPFEN